MNQKTDPRDYLIVALDVGEKEKALHLVENLSGKVGYFKIGLQLFTAWGPDIVKDVKSMGGKVFLDLKLHDIPNTVASAIRATACLEVSMLTIHTQGGYRMMAAAAAAAKEEAQKLGITPPRLLGVTILTSIDQEEAGRTGISEPIEERVLRLAGLAEESGIDGIVCSSLELESLRRSKIKDLFFVTPGIRPSGADVNDQSRITTPAQAIAGGARHLVVGRPITNHPRPGEAADRIVDEIEWAVSKISS